MEQIFLDAIFWVAVVYVVGHVLEMTLSLTRVVADKPRHERRKEDAGELFSVRCSFDRLPEQITSSQTV
ncbi:MAG: hypothetical protein JXN61_16975 [Sedimentisphaerales bacterium]|nr:hypothetical protein [Sedimentisphaerales bacterium]